MIEVVKKDVAFYATDEMLCEKLQITTDSGMYDRALELKEQVEDMIKPAYVMKEVPVGEKTKDGVELGGHFFKSKIVANKITDQSSAIIFIATCGKAIANLAEAAEDPMDNYILDQLAYIGYRNATDDMLNTLSQTCGMGRFIRLSPGSIIDWSVFEVKKFFQITDGLYQQLGLRVLDSGLIDPLKSGSGVIVESEEEFESCDLCMRPDCPSRRSPFDQEKYDAMINL